MKNVNEYSHRWSGWPGAHCLKCGSDDYMELAVSSNWFDPFTEQWDSIEHKDKAETHQECNTSDKDWYQHLVISKGKEIANSYFPEGVPTSWYIGE